MPDYRLKVRATSKPTMLELADDLHVFMLHAVNYVAVLSNPRFVSGYFVITSDVSIPQSMLDHLKMEPAP